MAAGISAGRHGLRVVRVVLLLQVACCVLGGGGADPRCHNRARSRSDAAADRGTKRRPETSAENSAANRLRISLVAQRSDLRVGILPTSQVIIIGRLRRAAALIVRAAKTTPPSFS